MASLATSRDRLKGEGLFGGLAVCVTNCRLSLFAPFGTVLEDPVRQSALKANVVSGLFGLDPLVLEDFFPLRLKFPVERRGAQQVTAAQFCILFRHTPNLCRWVTLVRSRAADNSKFNSKIQWDKSSAEDFYFLERLCSVVSHPAAL
jgi:hypothetical protein